MCEESATHGKVSNAPNESFAAGTRRDNSPTWWRRTRRAHTTGREACEAIEARCHLRTHVRMCREQDVAAHPCVKVTCEDTNNETKGPKPHDGTFCSLVHDIHDHLHVPWSQLCRETAVKRWQLAPTEDTPQHRAGTCTQPLARLSLDCQPRCHCHPGPRLPAGCGGAVPCVFVSSFQWDLLAVAAAS